MTRVGSRGGGAQGTALPTFGDVLRRIWCIRVLWGGRKSGVALRFPPQSST